MIRQQSLDTAVWDTRIAKRLPESPRIRWADETKIHAGNLWFGLKRNRAICKKYEYVYKNQSI